jgi:hypothetical protein
MASTYSDLKIELIGTGEQVGTWGATTNTNLGTALEEAITGSADVSFSSADVTLTLSNTNGTQTARNLRLVCTGTSGGARQLILGSGCQIEKLYLIQNDLADAVTVKNTTGTGVTVAAGAKAFVFNDGTNVVEATNLAGITGTVPVPKGGTGQTSYTDGQLLIGNTTGNTLTKATLTGTANRLTVTNGSGSITLNVDATNANTANKVVARDGSGNFSAGTITATLSGTASAATQIDIDATTSSDTSTYPVLVGAASTGNQTPFVDTGLSYNASTNALTATTFVGALSGNATSATTASSCSGNSATATVLQTARTINGTSFNGSANITVEPYVEQDTSTNATRYLTFVDSTTAGFQRLNVDTSGPTYNPSTNVFTNAGDITANSDVRLKDNIEIIGNALDKVCQIRGVTYTLKASNSRRHAGVIAQEVEKILPEVVIENEEGIKSVAYGNLVGLLIEAIKELKAEVNALKNKE